MQKPTKPYASLTHHFRKEKWTIVFTTLNRLAFLICRSEVEVGTQEISSHARRVTSSKLSFQHPQLTTPAWGRSWGERFASKWLQKSEKKHKRCRRRSQNKSTKVRKIVKQITLFPFANRLGFFSGWFQMSLRPPHGSHIGAPKIVDGNH